MVLMRPPVKQWHEVLSWLRHGSKAALLIEFFLLVSVTTAIICVAATFLWGTIEVGQPIIHDSFSGDPGH